MGFKMKMGASETVSSAAQPMIALELTEAAADKRLACEFDRQGPLAGTVEAIDSLGPKHARLA
jgi:hypothetical protein